MSAVLEAIEYYNLHIATDLVATGTRGAHNPYWMPRSSARFLPPSCAQSIVCTSLCHRILQLSDATESDQIILARRLQRHRGEALRALNADLAKQDLQAADATLASVLLLLLVEIQQSFEPPSWRNHGKGAAAIINLKGGFGNMVISHPYLCHLFRYYALIEVMGNTTSHRIETESARSQLELISLIPILYGNGLATCFPCPPDLLAEIIRINHLRSVFASATALTPSSDSMGTILQEENKHTAALDVFWRIALFSTSKWAAEVAVSTSGDENPMSIAGWSDIASIYQSAIAVYCLASLLHDTMTSSKSDTTKTGGEPYPYSNSNTGPNPDLKRIVAEARKMYASTLISKLKEASKDARLRKLVLWPLFVAGVEAGNEDARRFVAGELRWISNALGTATPLVARDLLEKRIWAFGLGKGSWDTIFDQSYVFVV
ncbi:fungal-specific transcription factor domain-containing protein [Corynascus similis CBS 632.67]